MHTTVTAAAILYGAKSTTDEHGSIPTQLQDARAMAEREGFEVVAEYSEDGRSAYRGNRGPQLAAAKEHAIRLVADGADVAIFVQHSDRIARGDGVEQMAVIQYVWEARAAGYSFRSCQDDSTFTEASGLMAFAMGLRNHEDSKRKSAATSAGIKRLGERGRHHGRAPYGYRWLGTGAERRLVCDEPRAAVIRRIFGEYVAGAGVALIAYNLDEDGVPPPRSARWDRHSTANILDSVAYVGKVRVNGETFLGEHEPIVEEGLWLRAQAQRQARKPGGGGRPPSGTHLLTGGLLHCGECGSYMRARTPKGRQARYDCSTHDRPGGRCSMRGVLRHDVDGPLLAYLEEVVFDVDATRQAIAEEHARRTAESAALIAQAEREVSEVDASFSRIRADYVAGKLDAEDWQSFRDELTERRTAAEAEAEQLRGRAAEVDAEAAAFDADREAAERLAALRDTVAGEVTGAEGLGPIRAALARVFERITLVRDGDELLLVPQVRAFDEIEAWARLSDGRTAVKPRPQALALPQKKQAREPS